MDERSTESPPGEPEGAMEAAPVDSVQEIELPEAEASDRFAPPPPGSPQFAARDPIGELDRLEGRLVALGVAVPAADPNRRIGTKTAEDRKQEQGPKQDTRSGKAGKADKAGQGKKNKKGGSKAKPKRPTASPGGGQGSDSLGLDRTKESKGLRKSEEPTAKVETEKQTRDEDDQGVEAFGSVDNRCAQLCEVAEAICSLETRLCELAVEHPDDSRYADACERAEQDCEVASNACQTCAG